LRVGDTKVLDFVTSATMEVTLSDTIGLPQGTLLSIRVGSTRRQAVVDSKFKLVFPKGCKHGEDIKVDALQQIGSNMMKYNESVGRYDLDLDDFGSKVSLNMREVIQPATEQEISAAPEAAKVDDSSVSHRHRVAVYARKYLDEHKLLTWAHKLFQDLIHDQPADPWGYIDKRSAEARGEAELAAKAEAEKKLAQADLEDIRQRTATQLQQAAEDGSLENALSHSQEAPELPPMSKELEDITDSQEVAHMKTEEEDLDNLRLKTQAALFRAAEDGSLQEVLGSKASQPAAKAPKDVDVLRLHAAQMLLSAAEDGSLEKALIDASKDTKDIDLLRQEAAATLLRAAEDGTLESVLGKNQVPKDDLESLRQEAANTLLAAAQDGRLEEVLTKKGQDQETNIEAIRQEAAAALCKAMEEGSLEAALAQAKGQKDVDVHVLKQEAATALLQAAQDGSLEKAFAEVKSEPQQELESLRTAAAETLLKAAVDGSLEQALRAAPRSGASGITSAGTSELGDLATDLVHAACQAAETPQGPLSVVFSQEPVDEDSLSKAKPVEQGKDIEAIRQAAARSLLKAAEDGTLESALGAVTMPSQQGSKADIEQIRIKAAASLLRAAEDGRLAEVLAPTAKGTTDVEQIRLKAAASLLRAAEDGRLAEVLAPKPEKDVDTMRKEAAAALLSAAQDGRLEAALAKETVSEAPAGGPPLDEEVRELARKTFEEAAADGRLADALSKALAPEPAAPPQAAKTEEKELEDLRVQAKDTLMAACADGSLEAAFQSKTQVAGLLAGWAADNCSTEQGQDVKAIKEKAADALVKALAMEDPAETTPEAAPLKSVPEPEAMAPPPPPPREDQAELNIQDVKARACNALHKALGLEDEQPVDLDDVKARAAGALEKALGVSESAATSKEETAEAEPAPAQPTLVAEVQEITRQVKEELGKFQGEVCGQLQDLKQLSSEVRKDVEDLRHQVAEAKREVSGSSTFGATTVTTIKPEDPLQDLAGGSLADLEKKIRERNERFRRENAAMREENARLKMMGPKAD